MRTILNVSFMLGTLLPFQSAFAAPGSFSYQGQIIKPNGQPLEENNVVFTIQLFSPGVEECLLYEETHTVNMSGSNGIFAINVGEGNRDAAGDSEDVSTLSFALSNSGGVKTPIDTCAIGNSYNPVSADSRDLRVTFTDSSGPNTLSQDHKIVSVPYADSATSIDGLAAADILQVNTGGSNVLTQSNLENVFDGANHTELLALIGGTSTQYLSGTPTANLDLNSNRIVNVSNPVGGNDATNKNYVDSTLGQAAIADLSGLTGTENGHVLTWNGTTWVNQVPSGDSTKLALAGGTMSGAIDMGSNNISNVNDLSVGNNVTVTGSVSANGVSSSGTVALYNGINFVAFQAPAGAGDVIWTLPVSDGTANQFLQTNGAGVLTWADAIPPVDSVFGRTGAVVAADGDYSASEIVNTPNGDIAANRVQAAIDELDAEKLPLAGGTMTGDLRLNTNSEIRFSDADNSDYVGFVAPNNITGGSFVWTLPATDGANGEVLSTDNAGNLSWISPIPADNSITTAKINDGAVTTPKLADNAVTNAKLADDAVNTSNLVDNAVTNAKLANDAVNTLNIIDNAVTNAKLANNAVGSANVLDNAITTAKINNLAVTNAKLAVGSVGTGNIIDNNVTTGKINDLAVTNGKLANDAVTSAKILDNQIVNADISSAAAIDAEKLAAGSVDNTEFGYLDGVTSSIQTQLGSKLEAADITGKATLGGDAGAVVLGSNDATLSLEANNNEAIRILANGNVGIGTTNPVQDLDIAGSSSGFVRASGGDGVITFKDNNASNTWTINSVANGGSPSRMQIEEDGSSVFVIDENGRVGIGTTTPLTKLDVDGTIKVSDGSETCSAAVDGGMIRYNGGNLQYCNGSAWTTLGVSGAGLTSLGGQTGSTQSFAAGSAGNSPAINSAGDTHTLNVPLASAGASVTSGTISNADYVSFGNKLDAVAGEALADGSIWVGNGSNQAAVVAMSGDATMINDGTLTISANAVNSAKIDDGTVATADLADNAVTSAKLGNNAVLTANILDQNVTTNKLADDSVTSTKINNGAILDADINASAGIAATKIAGGTVDNTEFGYLDGLTSSIQTQISANATNLSGKATLGGDAGVVVLGSNDNSLVLEANNSEAVRILANGNVGLGTTSPGASLHVRKNTGGINSLFEQSMVNQTADVAFVADGSTYGYIRKGYGSMPDISYIGPDFLSITNSAPVVIQTADHFRLFTGGQIATNERLRVLSSGEVGIGTTTPLTKLDVDGTIKVSDGSETCSAAVDGGMIRYNGGNLQYCNGSAWTTLGVSGAGLTSLGGQTGSTQSFAAGSAGNSPAINSAGDTHTLNVPLASAGGSVTSGTISNADYVSFSNKLDAVAGEALADGRIWVGNGSNQAAAVAVGGDATLANDGALSLVANSVDTAEINDSAVGANQLAANAVTSAKILDGAVDTSKIADNAVGTSKIDDASITNAKLASDAVQTANIADNAVTSAKISNGAITNDDINASAGIAATKIAGGSVDNTEFGYLDGVTSSIQTQISANATNLSGKATLGGDAGAVVLGSNDSTLVLEANNAEAVRILANGNVGVGTTNPTVKLDVIGSSRLESDSSSSFVINNPSHNAGAGKDVLSFDSQGQPNLTITDSDTGRAVQVGIVGNAGSINSVGEALMINTSGLNVVIGAGNEAEIAQLQVETSQASEVGLRVEAHASQTADIFQAVDGSSNIAMNVDASGNVGIGTTTPTAKLDVSSGNGVAILAGADQGAETRTDATDKVMRMAMPHYTNAEEGVALVQSISNATENRLDIGGGSSTLNTATSIRFHTATDQTTLGTSNERLRIQPNGNIGVGTTAPDTLLEVAGTLKLADGLEACSAADDGGMIRYSGGNLQFCNGSSWQTLGVSGAGLTSLGGQTGGAQTFAAGSAGNSPAIVSATDTHTLNVPLASASGTVTSGTISNADYVSFSNKLDDIVGETLASGSVWVGDGSNQAAAVTVSGDATLANDGTLTLAANSAGSAEIVDNSVSSDDILNATIVNADVSNTAAIAVTKIGNGDVDNGELSRLNGVTSNVQTQIDTKATLGGDAGAVTLGSNDNDLILEANNAEAVRVVASTGNVVVGDTSGSHKLNVKFDDSTVYNPAGAARSPLTVNTSFEVDNDSNTTGSASFVSVSAQNSVGTAAQGYFGIVSTASNYDGEIVVGHSTGNTSYVERMRIDVSGNVGIGTTVPGASLDVNGTDAIIVPNGTTGQRPGTPQEGMIRYNTTTSKMEAYENGGWADLVGVSGSFLPLAGGTMTGAIAMPDGTVGAPSLTFSDDTTTGIYSSFNDIINFSTGGSDAFFISDTVNHSDRAFEVVHSTALGYSPASVAASNPGFSLFLQNSEDGIANNYAGIRLRTTNTSTTRQEAYIGTVANGAGTTPEVVIGQQTGATAYNERLRISAAGNVGIGTTSATEKLVVGSDLGNITAGTAVAIGDPSGPSIYAAGVDTDNLGYSGWDNSSSHYSLGTVEASTSYQDTLVLKSGNVGIGSTTPTSRLDVNGTVTATNFVGSGAGLTGVGDLVNGGNDGLVTVGSTDNVMTFLSGGVNVGLITPSGQLSLGTVSTGPALYIENVGNNDLIINGNDPDIRLQAGGTDLFFLEANSSTGVTTVTNPNAGHIYQIGEQLEINTGNVSTGGLILRDQGFEILQITSSGGGSETNLDVQNEFVFNADSFGSGSRGYTFNIGGTGFMRLNENGGMEIGPSVFNNYTDSELHMSGQVWSHYNSTSGSEGAFVMENSGGNQSGFQLTGGEPNLIYTMPQTSPSAGQVLSSDTSGNLSWITPSSGDVSNGGNSFGSAMVIGTNDNYAVRIEANNSTEMEIFANNYGFDFGDDLSYRGANDGLLTVGSPGVTSGSFESLVLNKPASTDVGLRMTNSVTGSGSVAEGLTLYQRSLNSEIVNEEAGNMIFGTSGVEQMRIEADGDIGIGTSAPNGRLQVVKTYTNNTGPSGDVGLNVQVVRDMSGDGDAVTWGTSTVVSTPATSTANTTGGGYIFGSASSALHSGTGTMTSIYGSQNQALVFGGNTTNAVGLTANVGNGGANTITNAIGINVAVNANIGGGSITNNYGVLIENQAGIGSTVSDNLRSAGATSTNIFEGSVGIGAGTAPSVELDVTGDIEYTGTLTDVSDRRLKEDIMPLQDSLGKVLELQGVSFVMKDDPNKRKEIGVIAQQVEKITPELVHTADDEQKTKSVNYIGFIGYIIEAVKELADYVFDKNEEQDRELASLKKQNQDLMDIIKKQQEQIDAINKKLDDNKE